MLTYTFTTPAIISTGIGRQLTVNSVQVTGIWYTSTPALSQLGTGELEITLTDPDSGWQETMVYQDASVLTFWTSVQSPAANTSLGDVVAEAVFTKLAADGKLPGGTITTTPDPVQGTVGATGSAEPSGATGATGA